MATVRRPILMLPCWRRLGRVTRMPWRSPCATGRDWRCVTGRAERRCCWRSAGDHVEAARVLVAMGADPDALDDQHDTPWLVTGVTGSVEMLEALLPASPDLGLVNRFGGVSVIPASERGHVEYVRRVVSTGIDVEPRQPAWAGPRCSRP